LKVGLYCSPWDRNHPAYGDSPRYNDVFCEQLTELLTQYGPVHEVWFDGANGEGPNGKKQQYDFPRFWAHVRKLQPNAVMFSDAGPDIRWIGNENGTVWRAGETDVSIRPGWFYHPAEDARVKTVDQLVELYFTSVGRNSKLLLNVPPTPEGLLHNVDVDRLTAMRRELARLFSGNQTQGARITAAGRVHTLTLSGPRPVSILDLREDITKGQVVARYVVEGASGNTWSTLARGTTIGYKRLHRIPTVTVDRLRLTVEEALADPSRMELRAWHPTG
jgi:alpha-L-fucosidase